MSREVQEKAVSAAADASEKPKAAAKPAAKTAGTKATSAAKKAPAKNAAGKKPVATKQSAAPVKTANKPAAKTPEKSAAKTTAAADKPAKPAAKEKAKKAKLVRDSFTMPENEYQVLGDVKKSFLKIGISVKKSELLRAGVALIKAMEIGKLKTVIDGLPPIKAGRPKKDK
jgi:hypothetical protein